MSSSEIRNQTITSLIAWKQGREVVFQPVQPDIEAVADIAADIEGELVGDETDRRSHRTGQWRQRRGEIAQADSRLTGVDRDRMSPSMERAGK